MTDACNKPKNTQKDAMKIVYLPNTVWLSKSTKYLIHNWSNNQWHCKDVA